MHDLSTGHDTVTLRDIRGFLGEDIGKDSWYEGLYDEVSSKRR
jgi:hypothetical protein